MLCNIQVRYVLLHVEEVSKLMRLQRKYCQKWENLDMEDVHLLKVITHL
jgi:hypothetical protein